MPSSEIRGSQQHHLVPFPWETLPRFHFSIFFPLLTPSGTQPVIRSSLPHLPPHLFFWQEGKGQVGKDGIHEESYSLPLENTRQVEMVLPMPSGARRGV